MATTYAGKSRRTIAPALPHPWGEDGILRAVLAAEGHGRLPALLEGLHQRDALVRRYLSPLPQIRERGARRIACSSTSIWLPPTASNEPRNQPAQLDVPPRFSILDTVAV